MITIYGTDGCLACLKAKQCAEIFELEHEYISLARADIETKKKFYQIDTHFGMVPQIVWGDDIIVGLADFEKRVNEFLQKETDNGSQTKSP